jgi:hypothetical protein
MVDICSNQKSRENTNFASARKAKFSTSCQAAYFPYQISIFLKLAPAPRWVRPAAMFLYFQKSTLYTTVHGASALTGFGLWNLDFLARTFDILLASNHGMMNLNPDP